MTAWVKRGEQSDAWARKVAADEGFDPAFSNIDFEAYPWGDDPPPAPVWQERV